MVGVPGENGERAVELFQEHDAQQLMGPGGLTESDGKDCFLAQTRCEPVVAANDKNNSRLIFGPPAL
jgi:hypothetical protein